MTSPAPHDSHPLPALGEALRQAEERLSSLRAEADRLSAWIDVTRAILNGAPMPVSAHSLNRAVPLVQANTRKTLTTFVVDTLDGADGGRTRQELSAEIEQSAFAEQHKANPNGLYTVISRLKGRGKIVERGRLLYSPAVIAKIDSGELEDARSDEWTGTRTLTEHILSLLLEHGPLTAREVIDLLKQEPEMAERLQRNMQSAYTTLSKLVTRGELARIDGKYAIQDGESDAPDDGSADTSDHPPKERGKGSLL